MCNVRRRLGLEELTLFYIKSKCRYTYINRDAYIPKKRMRSAALNEKITKRAPYPISADTEKNLVNEPMSRDSLRCTGALSLM